MNSIQNYVYHLSARPLNSVRILDDFRSFLWNFYDFVKTLKKSRFVAIFLGFLKISEDIQRTWTKFHNWLVPRHRFHMKSHFFIIDTS